MVKNGFKTVQVCCLVSAFKFCFPACSMLARSKRPTQINLIFDLQTGDDGIRFSTGTVMEEFFSNWTNKNEIDNDSV